MFFTRLPFHKIKQVPSECFSHVTGWWSITGWLTGGLSALTCWLLMGIATPGIAIVAALIVRVMLTGALHEDGLADCLDGFGGGNDKEGTLRIMKDSHIGAFGVIGLVLYFLMTYAVLSAIGTQYVPVVILASDVFAKCVSSHIVWLLPYARPESESKNRTVYSHPTIMEETLTIVSGIVAIGVMCLAVGSFMFQDSGFNYALCIMNYALSIIVTVAVFLLLVLFFRKRIGGYTGDCCGAMFLLCELSFRLMIALI